MMKRMAVNCARAVEAAHGIDEREPQGAGELHGCHCDLEPDMSPDGCVIDEGRPQDCVYARRVKRKEDCQYWRPIALAAAPKDAATQGKTDPVAHGLPPYPAGEVAGPCVCGSWPGGKCLRCEVIPAKANERGSAEPWRCPTCGCGVNFDHRGCNIFRHPDSAQARDAILEDAAQACEGRESMDADACAAAIRALIAARPQAPSDGGRGTT